MSVSNGFPVFVAVAAPVATVVLSSLYDNYKEQRKARSAAAERLDANAQARADEAAADQATADESRNKREFDALTTALGVYKDLLTAEQKSRADDRIRAEAEIARAKADCAERQQYLEMECKRQREQIDARDTFLAQWGLTTGAAQAVIAFLVSQGELGDIQSRIAAESRKVKAS